MKNNRGGFREGAGRPTFEDEPYVERVTVIVSKKDKYMLKSMTDNFSQWFRNVIREKYEEKNKEESEM